MKEAEYAYNEDAVPHAVHKSVPVPLNCRGKVNAIIEVNVKKDVVFQTLGVQEC